jgi:hypothetical protein
MVNFRSPGRLTELPLLLPTAYIGEMMVRCPIRHRSGSKYTKLNYKITKPSKLLA